MAIVSGLSNSAGPTTAPQQLSRTKRSFDDSWTNSKKGNLGIIDEVCSPDFAFHSPNWPNWARGLEGARKLATYGSMLYRDAHGTLDDIIAEGDRVAVRWTITGTSIGERRPGIPDYGEKVAVGAMSWYRFVDGKIAEDWGTEVFWPNGTLESEIRKWRGDA